VPLNILTLGIILTLPRKERPIIPVIEYQIKLHILCGFILVMSVTDKVDSTFRTFRITIPAVRSTLGFARLEYRLHKTFMNKTFYRLTLELKTSTQTAHV